MIEIEKMEHIKSVCETIYRQIGWSASKEVMMSWGISKLLWGYHNDMATLKLKVNGLIHKGWVYVSYNEGSDVYIVTLLDNKNNIKSTHTPVYCDNLGSYLDNLIEKKTEWSYKEYEQELKKSS